MISRLARRPAIRGVAADLLNQLSFLTVVALLLAIIIFSGANLGRRVGLIHTNPLQAFGGPRDPTQGLDAATRAESGLAPPLPLGVANPFTPPSQPTAEDIGVIPVPSPRDLARPLHSGTWLPILMFHYVRDVSRSDVTGWTLSVSPDDFRKEMEWLRDHGYTAMTMRDVDLVLAGKRQMPLNPVALTFDDGYRDFYTTAAPILRDTGFTATNYVPTQLVGGSAYMTWNQIQELDREGFEMAAHTQYHVDISNLPDNRARAEVFGAKADLESHLGHQVVDWAYPYGGVSVAAAALIREAGFWSGTTTNPGGWHDPTQLLYLSRVRVSGGAGLQAVINGVTPPLPILPLVPSR
ncbi:MAG: polysaccharide deacetylase family protein [Candidatus Dormibacteria bacterium]